MKLYLLCVFRTFLVLLVVFVIYLVNPATFNMAEKFDPEKFLHSPSQEVFDSLLKDELITLRKHLELKIRKSQDLAKDFGGTASKAKKKICKSKNCKLYIET